MVQRDTPWEPGTPSWVDLTTSDPSAANDFYRQLFGWQIEVGGPETGNYAMCFVDGRPVAGIGGMPPEGGHPPVWTTYLATNDAEATVATGEKLGASVVVPAMDVMDFGRMAVLQLPGGGAVGLWQAGSHHGFGLANDPNSVTWNEFLTRDVEGAKAFYAELFGYKYVPIEGAGNYSMITLDGENAVGGIGELPAEVPAHVPPHWRVYFAVEDADACTAKAADLGGSVLQEPHDMPYGRWADVADPQGAMFSVVRPPGA